MRGQEEDMRSADARKALDFKTESAAFEAWAARWDYDLSQHPLHYLFLNRETACARDGWREAIAYARTVLAKPKAEPGEAGTPNRAADNQDTP